MKDGWNANERELGGMKSISENYYKKLIWKLPKATAFQSNIYNVFRKNKIHSIVCNIVYSIAHGITV